MFSSMLYSFIVGSHLPVVVALLSSTTAMGNTSSPASCASSMNACLEDSMCSTCLSGWDADPSLSECDGQYSSIAQGDSCVKLAASSCCSLGDEAMVDSCVNNEMFVQYWGCYMNESNCDIEDMPCYPGTATASPSLSPIPAPTASPLPFNPTSKPRASNYPTTAPTATASLSSVLGISMDARDLGLSEAPTALPSAMDPIGAQCANQTTACLDNEVCQGCMADVAILAMASGSQDDFSECEIGYLGSPSEAGVCEVAGAMYCCANEGECVDNGPSSEYWRCIFDALLCSMVDVTCMGGIGGSYRSDDDSSIADDGGVTAEETGSSQATRRWLRTRTQPHVLFAVLLVEIAFAARPLLLH